MGPSGTVDDQAARGPGAAVRKLSSETGEQRFEPLRSCRNVAGL